MAKVVITIETDNAAFHEEAGNPYQAVGIEVGRILRDMADDFEGNYTNHRVPSPRDINENVVGQVEIVE